MSNASVDGSAVFAAVATSSSSRRYTSSVVRTASSAVAEAVKGKLRAERGRLDPLELLHRIREGQAALAALAAGELGSGPERESLEQFLAKLPEVMARRGSPPDPPAASTAAPRLAD